MKTATSKAEAETWTTPHQVYVLHQAQESTTDGIWKSKRHTGLSNLVCNCGYSTGWVETEDLDMDQLLRDHAAPMPLDAPFVP